jgi:hypothetical protein
VVGQVGAGGQKSGSSIFLSCRAVGKPLAAGGFFVSFSSRKNEKKANLENGISIKSLTDFKTEKIQE